MYDHGKLPWKPESKAYSLHQSYHLTLNILLLKHHLFLFPYSYMLHLSFKFSFRKFSKKNFFGRIENLALKTALKACSLEHEPHIMVVTPFIPLGAHRSSVFFNFIVIKIFCDSPFVTLVTLSFNIVQTDNIETWYDIIWALYFNSKLIIPQIMKHSENEKIHFCWLYRSDRR